jgi:hypothetical protein
MLRSVLSETKNGTNITNHFTQEVDLPQITELSLPDDEQLQSRGLPSIG